MTVRAMGDPLGAFNCPKCGAISTGPSLKWTVDPKKDGEEYIWIKCDDCGYGERRPTADAVNHE